MYELQQEQNQKLEDIIRKNSEEQDLTLKIIQDLTSLVTKLHRTTTTSQSSTKQHETLLKPTGTKSDAMNLDKESHKRKDPHTPCSLHQKTRATANIE